MSAWYAIGGGACLFGAAMCGKAEEEAKVALEALPSLTNEMEKAWSVAKADHASRFPTPEQAYAIEGYRQVGPC